MPFVGWMKQLCQLLVLNPSQAKNILIATGGRSSRPNVPGAELCIDSDLALELPTCPKKITIIGGGYIAVEFAGIFRRFGAEVHIVIRQDRPLRGFDDEVGGARLHVAMFIT